MKINFHAILKDLDDKNLTIEDGDKTEPLTLERVAISSLLQCPNPGDGEDKYKRYRLMRDIHGDTAPVDITTEDAARLKKAIGQSAYTPIVTGQAWDLIENGPDPIDEKIENGPDPIDEKKDV